MGRANFDPGVEVSKVDVAGGPREGCSLIGTGAGAARHYETHAGRSPAPYTPITGIRGRDGETPVDTSTPLTYTLPMSSTHITPDELAELVRYDPTTGHLYWRERQPKHFDSDTPAEHCATWNRRFAGKQAFKRKTSSGGLSGRVFHYTISAARAAFCLHWGRWPTGIIEHWDGDNANNKFNNLRDTTHSVERMGRKAGGQRSPVGPSPTSLWGLHYSGDECMQGAPQEGHGDGRTTVP